MMQSELLLPTSNFPFYAYQNNTPYNDQCIDISEIVDGVFSFSSFASSEDISMVSSEPYFQDISPNYLFDHDNVMITSEENGFQKISTSDIDDICEWIYSDKSIHGESQGTSSSAEVSADEWSPSPSLETSQNTQLLSKMLIDLPMNDIKLDNELSLLHLLIAYGEAMNDGNSNGSLAKVIVQSIKEKSSCHGNLIQRVAYHMFKSKDDVHGEYLRQESIKNFGPALNVLYQSLICGRFAHNAANTAILESLPNNVTMLHIIDFDIGEGIQWPTLIEALSQKHNTVRLTAIKQEGEDCTSSPSCWDFEETKKRLHDHARQYGLKMYIEEKCIEDFAEEMKRRRQLGCDGDWLVFNCMAALPMPHMGRRRRVVEFLKLAEELLANNFDGIVTFGDGEAGDELRSCNDFESYFGKMFTHYQALFEALECNLPGYVEARMVMECLFLAPFMNPVAWFEEWKEMAKGREFESVLEGQRASRESLLEAQVMVDERDNWYNVRIEGIRENEMVLRWKEIVLVRVSTLCSRR